MCERRERFGEGESFFSLSVHGNTLEQGRKVGSFRLFLQAKPKCDLSNLPLARFQFFFENSRETGVH